MIPFSAVLVLLFLFGWWVRSAKRKDLPPGPTPLPFLGNAHQLFWAYLRGKTHVDVFIEWKKKYGNVYTMYIGPFHCVIIADYKTAMDAFVKNAEHHADRPPFFMFNTIRNDLGVTFAKGPGWQEQRRFSLRTLRDFGFGRNIMQIRILEELHYRTERLDRVIDGNGGKPLTIDPRHFMDLLVSSIINRILVGYRYDEEHFDEFKTIKYGLDREFDSLTIWDLAWLNNSTYRLPGFRHRWDLTADHQRVMHDHMKKTVRKRLEEIASGHHHLDFENGGDDYIDAYLIKLHEKTEKNEFLGWFSEDSLAVNLLDLWMAGTETTIQSLMWFLIFALNDLPIQEKVREECYAITGGNRDVELKDRPNMPYMNAVITEVLRCTNVLNFNFIHQTTCKTVVGEYIIPEEACITSQLSVILNDETDFPDHAKFDPERYIRDKELSKKVIAFGVGKRACVGESLARAELFLIISNFCQKYKFSPPDECSPPTTNELSPLLFLKRTHRFNMRIEKLVSGVQSGIMSFLDTTVHYDFDMIGGALNCVGLFGRPLFLLILALNRFVNLTRLIRSRKNEKIVFSVLLAIASLATFFGFAYRITIGKAHYYLGYDIYRPLKTTGAAAIIKHITVGVDITAIALATLIYFGVFAFIIYKRKTTRMLALLKSTDIPVIAQGIITLSHAAVVKCGTGHIFVSMLESRPANIAYIIWLETMTLINPLSYLILVSFPQAAMSEMVVSAEVPYLSRSPSLSLDNAVIGLLYLFANGLVLPIYIIFLLIFIRKDPYRHSMTFKIMFCLGVVECLQLVSGIQSGVMTLADSTLDFHFNLVGGAFNCVGLFGRPLFILVLALNRFVKITGLITAKRSETLLFSVLLAVASLLCGLYFVYRLSIGRSWYLLTYDIFRPMRTTGVANVIKHITVGLDMAAIGLATIIYVAVFGCIIYKRRTAQSSTSLKSTDIPVIVQAVITLCHAVIVRCGAGNVFAELLDNRAANIFSIVWLEVMALVNPLSYLLLVKTLRKSFLQFVRLRGTEATHRTRKISPNSNLSSRRNSRIVTVVQCVPFKVVY
ncbi:hypothetical protein QR680_009998 [Steinernema hermaphroditum]|uniref:Serpentine receptor class gamma n=1 Tax=Steinernema hermaphroditum TaxID=289476 RepID=A0AA39IP11_9BILA|nr:hypothetical protein QR680_009998 [Steinernema hermaphroditum]